MANQVDRYENEGIDMDLSGMGSALHGGSAVQQGMRGYSRRTEERGRDEFHGNGGSAELDPGRIHEGGRHYGRPAVDEPAPDGGPPGRPDLGEMRALQAAQLQVIEADAMGPVALSPPSMLQTRHGEAQFTNDRAEVEPMPPAIADRPRHEVPSLIEVPESPAAKPSRKTTARATPQTARKAATRTGTKAAGKGTARSESTTRETSKPAATVSAAKKPAAKVSAAKKPAAKVSAAKKPAAKVSAAKKPAAKVSAAKVAPAKTSTVKKAPAKASGPKKATAKKVTAKKVTAKKVTAKKVTAKKVTAKKAPAKKASR